MEAKEKEERIERRYEKEYSLYKMGSTVATGLPIEVLKFEARRRDLDVDKFIEKFKAVVYYNNFEGVHIEFKEKEAST